MNYTLPTTKAEMFETLNEIFHHYRVKLPDYDDVELKRIQLQRIEFTPLTETELINKAEQLVKAEQSAQIREYKTSNSKRITELNCQLGALSENLSKQVALIKEEYEKSKAELQAQAIKLGVSDSTILVEQLALLESQKLDKLAELDKEVLRKEAEMLAEMEALNQASNLAESYFSSEHLAEKEKKLIEIKDEQEKTIREVQKYNNSLDEKEQRQSNTIQEASATLRLKFLQICSEGLSKEQLIEMGYYKDVIECVCGYYNTLSAVEAFSDICNEGRLVMYLDDYYHEIISMYQIKAAG